MAIPRIIPGIFLFAALTFAQTPAKPPQTPAKPAAAPSKPATAKPAAGALEDDDPLPAEIPGSLFPAVVARVNNRSIFGRDMERRIQAQLQPIGNPEWKNLKEDYRKELTSQSLGGLIAAELIYQKAVSLGMKATEAEVQAEFAKTAKTFASDAEMNIALANRGYDRSSFLRELSKSLTVERYVRETVGKKIAIAPAEVEEYYKAHKKEFTHPDLVRSSHILILVPEGASAEQDQASLQRSRSILARLKKGEDFAKLAKENSMDDSASSGGDIGLVPKGNLAPEYEAVAFALPVGGISDPVRTKFGYHIIKVTEKKREGIAELEEVRNTLTEYLKNQKIEAELTKNIDSLRASAKIDLLIDFSGSLTFGGATISNPRP